MRSGYNVDARFTQQMYYDDANQLVHFWETAAPTWGPTGVFGTIDWSWETLDWRQTTYLAGDVEEVCDSCSNPLWWCGVR